MARILYTQHLRRAMASGATITTKTGAPVALDPRTVRDRRPWVDGDGGRWAGSECRAVHPEPEPVPEASPKRPLPPGVQRRLELRALYKKSGIDWDAELGQAS